MMARIDIRDLDEDTLKLLDEQCKKYGISSRSDYIRMLIKLDIMTNMVQIIKDKENK
jgi:metal-responsive CopG/Arc/MetJ family transcriptional regulator